MINEEAAHILRQGTNAWTEWRKQHPQEKPFIRWTELSNLNLGGADLSGIDLVGTDLSESNFSSASFNTANLSEANLSSSNLAEADLSEANLKSLILCRSNLSRADIRDSDLSEADLREARLIGAILDWAIINDANFTNADFGKSTLLNPEKFIRASLSKAKINGSDFSRADLSEANISGASIYESVFYETRLVEADLHDAEIVESNLTSADLSYANLSNASLSDSCLYMANLSGANLNHADLSYADLRGADLTYATLVGTNLEHADLTGCKIYGISAWDLNLEDTTQSELLITYEGQPSITVDSLEVGQFIYLLLNNQKIRSVIDTVSSKVVLILGRFTESRKQVLDAMREELRKHNYLPVLFDFDKPDSRDLTETISTLAHMAKFIIADITEAKSIPQELQAIVPDLPSVPVQPLLIASDREYAMFEHFKRYPWVLKLYRYKSNDELLRSLTKKVIAPAEAKIKEIHGK